MKPAFADMVGNEALRERLRDDICADRLSHAYIIEGAEGFGKHMLALRIAAALACENRGMDGLPLPCMECASCRKILSGNSPDVIPISRGDKATLGVEAVRLMHTGVCIAPNELDRKCYLIEDAHLMTVQAQNAFLLTLEEPPPYVCFLLLCESTAPLLETVRSRAPTLRLEPIPPDGIREHLLRTEPAAKALEQQAPEELRELIAAAGGSIGRARLLLDPKRRKPIWSAGMPPAPLYGWPPHTATVPRCWAFSAQWGRSAMRLPHSSISYCSASEICWPAGIPNVRRSAFLPTTKRRRSFAAGFRRPSCCACATVSKRQPTGWH